MANSRAALIVVSGLPGAGKTTVAGAYVRATGAAYLRIDTIEQTILNRTSLVQPLGPVGYEVGYALAGEQLRLGTKTVVAECVNPLAITRDAWQGTAEAAAAFLVDVEVVCSDLDEHRHRVETRTSEIPGLTLPTWQQVSARQYEPWHRDRLIVHTAQYGPDQCAAAFAEAVDLAHAGPRT
jgi:predicted kinase